jgi:hypothetical protein
MKAWQAEGVAPHVLAVNVSGVQLKSAELEREVAARIAKWDLNPGETGAAARRIYQACACAAAAAIHVRSVVRS